MKDLFLELVSPYAKIESDLLDIEALYDGLSEDMKIKLCLLVCLFEIDPVYTNDLSLGSSLSEIAQAFPHAVANVIHLM